MDLSFPVRKLASLNDRGHPRPAKHSHRLLGHEMCKGRIHLEILLLLRPLTHTAPMIYTTVYLRERGLMTRKNLVTSRRRGSTPGHVTALHCSNLLP